MAPGTKVLHRSETVPQNERNEALDAIRIIAAVGVLLFHARIATQVDPGLLGAPWLSLNMGVMVFFTLSGYLVTRPFLDGGITPLDHLTRRMVRLAPAYVAAVIGWIVVFGAMDLRLGGVAWTLLLEVMFYAALPFILALTAIGARGRHGRQVLALLALGGLSFVARYVFLGDGATWALTERVGPLWLWAFVPGMLVACAHAWYPGIMTLASDRAGLTLGGVVTLSVLVVPDDPGGPMTITRMALVAVGTAILLPGLMSGRLPIPGRSLLAAAGRSLSYPVYLWHPLVIFAIAAAGIGGWTAIGLALVVTLVVAAFSWRLVERPTLTIHRRLRARERPGLPTARGRLRGVEHMGRSVP
ncbi:MAG: acyltransferase [Chloroflexota bacterium]